MKKLLITGASGFLGWNLCRTARQQWKVYGVVNTHCVSIDAVETVQCDLTDFSQMESLFQDVMPDAVIHTAAAADPNFCQAQPERSHRINVAVSQRIAQMCAVYDARCAFTSTDLVFDGTKAPYSEKSPAAPLSLYGKQKVEAERRMMQAYGAMLICRMPLMFGDAPAPAKSIIQPMIQGLLASTPMKLFVDEFRTPVEAGDAARGILSLMESKSGIFNLGGKVRISRYDFGMLLSKTLGLDLPAITPVYQSELVMAAPRPPDVSLDSTKAFLAGYNPDPPEVALARLTCVQEARNLK